MTELSITDARAGLPAAIKKALRAPVHILKHGDPVAVLISPSLYREMLEAIEELEDIAAYDKAKSEIADTYPWESIKKELGLS